LAFQSDREGNWDIYDVRLGCKAPEMGLVEAACDLRQLTDDVADDFLPAWSPDGRRIAFVSTRDGNPEIYVMDSAGQNQRRLTFHPGGDWRPAWLPDSQHLVFTSERSGNNDIYRLAVPDLEDGPLDSEPEVVAIVTGTADDRDPAVMATYLGKVLFLSDRDGVWRTYYQDLGYLGSSAFAQTETEHPEAHPATLPAETNWILISSNRDGPSNIYQAILGEYKPMAPSKAFDGQPAAEATAWQPASGASLSWLEGFQE
jgi:dipeptidyl aminopeptidase/acylaminoacyl peptidase